LTDFERCSYVWDKKFGESYRVSYGICLFTSLQLFVKANEDLSESEVENDSNNEAGQNNAVADAVRLAEFLVPNVTATFEALSDKSSLALTKSWRLVNKHGLRTTTGWRRPLKQRASRLMMTTQGNAMNVHLTRRLPEVSHCISMYYNLVQVSESLLHL
jgi:hypothetical protein